MLQDSYYFNDIVLILNDPIRMIVMNNKRLFLISIFCCIFLLLGITYLSFLYPGILAPIDKLRYHFCKTTIEKVDNAESERFECGLSFSRDYTKNAISYSELAPYLEELNPGTVLVTSHGKSVCARIPGMWKHTMIYLGTHQQVKEYFGEDSELYQVIKSYFKKPDEHLIIDASFKQDVAIRCISNMANLNEESTLKYFLCFEPKLSRQDNLSYIKNSFQELGKKYDLTFDDSDAQELYCTEFINNSLHPFGISFDYHSHFFNRSITLPNDMVNSIMKDYMPERFTFKLCITKKADKIVRLNINDVAEFPQDHWMN